MARVTQRTGHLLPHTVVCRALQVHTQQPSRLCGVAENCCWRAGGVHRRLPLLLQPLLPAGPPPTLPTLLLLPPHCGHHACCCRCCCLRVGHLDLAVVDLQGSRQAAGTARAAMHASVQVTLLCCLPCIQHPPPQPHPPIHSPSLPTFSMIFCGCSWSTVQPTLCAVPSISLHVPASDLATLRGRITRAISTMSSMLMLPLCLMFFSCWFCGGGVEGLVSGWRGAGKWTGRAVAAHGTHMQALH
jgi:hypothetical protein